MSRRSNAKNPGDERERLTASIRGRARSLGFGLFGVTPAEPLPGSDFYARWVALGYAGEMEYLRRNREKRADPRLLVPGAVSVICVGMNYYPGPQEETAAGGPDSPGLRGRISAYARGDDYHELVKKRLAELWRFIEEEAGRPVRGRWYVDTAPVLERELAQRAGLGWWGKNTCLINKRQGSWFFLGEIITDLELQFDEPAVDHCGTCTRCLDACPTDAFPEPYVLDSRRCISYLTIELRTAIPGTLRPGIGDWLFGCDVCQEVCPWNRKAAPARETAFASRPGLEQPDLAELMKLDAAGFNRLFRNSPVKRPKRAGFLRNVAVALGNSGRPEAVGVLIPALKNEEPLVRGHAAWALGRLGGPEAEGALRDAMGEEEDAGVREEISDALNRCRGPRQEKE